MKKRKLFALASTALSAAIFASCSTSQPTSFTSNWYSNPSSNNVLEGQTETLVYSVNVQNPENAASFFEYSDGSYTTTLSTEKQNNELLYSYTTELNISVIFNVNGEKSEKYTDKVTSKVLFRSAPSLRPVRSEKTVCCHAPNTQTPDTLSGACFLYNYSVEIDYSYEGSAQGKSVYTDLTKTDVKSENTFEIPDKYSYLDNEQILFALRGVSHASSHQLFRNNSASRRTVTQSFKTTPASAVTDEFKFKLNGSDVTKSIEYYPVSIAVAEKNPGATHTAWYANASSGCRNVMLRLESPLYYGLGTMVYTLREANFTEQ